MPIKAKNNSPYLIRNYQPSDFDKYVLLLTEVEKLNPTGRCVSPQFIAKQLKRPNYCPEQDLFIAETDNAIAGSINIESELAIKRVILDCNIQPDHHDNKDLTKELYNSSLRRARELGAKVAHVNITEDNVAAREIILELGFSFVRWFLELKMDISCVDRLRINPSREYHYLRQGEEEILTELQNRAFAGSWGYNPNNVDEIIFRIDIDSFSRKDIFLTYDKDRAIGCCWTGIICEQGIPSPRKGRVHMLGVDPDYRRKGIGRELMMIGLTHLNNKGLQVAELTVDSENKAAHTLYQSIGFRAETKTAWYEKITNQDTGIR